MKTIKIGTRGSRLAMWQAEYVRAHLAEKLPHATPEIITISTQGDRVQDLTLFEKGDKGLFTREIESALLSGEIDLAVHSAKDLPTVLPEGLCVGAFTEREKVQDVLVLPEGVTWNGFPENACIGTSSLRRKAQLLHRHPGLSIEPIRGNVDTRIRKLDEGQFDGIILARAGMKRLGFADRISAVLDMDLVLPAVGQGALALEIREGDDAVGDAMDVLRHETSEAALIAERALLHELEAGCRAPVGAWARIEGEVLRMDAMVADPDGKRLVRDRLEGRPADAEALGRKLARQLIDAGAAAILEPLLEKRKASPND
ncbi:MAG: hydroxymethylbilane synthase [Candidatus Sumerlaeia bacterium]